MNKNFFNKGFISYQLVLVILFLAIIFLIPLLSLWYKNNYGIPSIPLLTTPLIKPLLSDKIEVKKFASDEEFKSYINRGSMVGSRDLAVPSLDITSERSVTGNIGLQVPSMGVAPKAVADRVSGTNVQVRGIDEPDIVKTDGKSIYFSSSFGKYFPMEVRAAPDSKIVPPIYTVSTKIIDALPESLKTSGKINKTGDLLLVGETLVIFSGQEIVAYDVKKTAEPSEKWKVNLENNSYLVAARLHNNKIYLIARTGINFGKPCPVRPLTVQGSAVVVPCTEIYHPVVDTPVDTTFTVTALNPASGKSDSSISFTGSVGSSVVYMSNENLYITNTFQNDLSEFIYRFYTEKGRDLISDSTLQKLENLQKYEISKQAKFTELGVILSQYYNSLDENEKLKIENETQNRMKEYAKEHMRELEKTVVTKVAVSGLKLAESGSFPGHPLNQFALDEFNGNLRVATTVGGGWWMSSVESANDVYVLDGSLKTVGSVLNLGLGERIYSVRFVEDKGYLVTFKQIDPFYVLDLSDPKKPEVKGELKIPGYSSYLDPIAKDRVLGLGMEGSQVKLSLFDVSSAANPKEIDKYMLSEYWSEAANNHHAFLLDSKHQVFFMPGGKGGYIFSYQGDKLTLKRAISNIQAKRAIYINDYLYIVGDAGLVVVDENSWEVKNQIDF